MDVIRSLEEAGRRSHERAVAVGFFDGVHLGHQEIIRGLVEKSQSRGIFSTCLTFDPHPMRVLGTSRFPQMLSSLEERTEMISSFGVQSCVVIPFTREFAMMEPEEFAGTVLSRILMARIVLVGFNFSFGRQGRGGPCDLLRMGPGLGFETFVYSPVVIGGVPVSSTGIREALLRGDVVLAREMLGRPYRLNGDVVKGEGRGRLLRAPTANLLVSPEKLLPGNGVYAAMAVVDGRKYGAVTNIGARPTFHSSGVRTVEAHLLDFRGDLYGKRIQIAFLKKIREEKQFESGDDLTRQIGLDTLAALDILRSDSQMAT